MVNRNKRELGWKRISTFGTCVLVWAAPHTVFAQSAKAGANTPSNKEPLEIVVTAQRRSERAKDVPISLTVRSGKDLAAAGVNNIKDLQLVVPGLTSTTQGAFYQPTIRGVSTQGSEAGSESPVGVYVDGVYQANMLSNVADLPDVERVEVLKGPQGTLFGRSNTAGAILVHTMKPSFALTGNGTVSYGRFTGGKSRTDGEEIAKGYISGSIVPSFLAASIAGLYQKTGKYFTDDRTGKRAGGAERYLIRGKLLVKPTDNLTFIPSLTYSHLQDDIAMTLQPLNGVTAAAANPQPGDVIPREKYHIASENPGGTSPLRATMWQASLTGSLDLNIGSFNSTTAYTKIKAKTLADLDGTYSPSCRATFACITFGVDYPTKNFQQELLFSSRQFGAFQFVAGSFYFQDNSMLSSSINPFLLPDGRPDPSGAAPISYSGRVKTKSIAGFGEANFDITDKLRLSAGARYTWEKKTGIAFIPGIPPFAIPPGGLPNIHAWTPRASVRYKISPDANIYATYSKGQKSAVISTSNPGQFALPEKLTSYEAGLKFSRQGSSFNLAAFYYDYKDLQAQITRVQAFLSNAASAQLLGIEGDAAIRLSRALTFRAGGSYLPQARYKNYKEAPAVGGGAFDASGLRMIRAPRFTGNASLSFERESPLGKLDAQANLFYSTKYKWDITSLIITRSHAYINAQFGLTLHDTGLRLSLFGKNLTNASYIASALQSASALGVRYAEPRQIGVAASYMF